MRLAARCHTFDVPSYKPRVIALFLTFLVLLFLWLAPLQLFFAALLAALHRPQLLDVLLPNTPVARALFWNTVTMAIGTSVLAVIFGAPCGIAMARGPKMLRGVFTVLCALPLALPPLLFATVWLAITRLASPRMQASLAASSTTTIPPVLVAAPLLALCFYPIVAFAVRAALLSIAPDAENAARLHGGSFSVWRRVLWPLLMPAVWGAAGLVAALAMWEMPAPDLLDARTYAVQIYMSLNDADGLDLSGKAVKSALQSLPLIVLGALALWPALRARSFYGAAQFQEEPEPREYSQTSVAQKSVAREGKIAALFAIPVVVASPLAAIAGLVYQLGSFTILREQWQANDTEIYNTIFTPTFAACLMLLVAFLLIGAWREWQPRARVLALTLCALPVLCAPVILALALIGFWNRPGFALIYGGLPPTDYPLFDAFADLCARHAMTVIGYCARFFPPALLLLYAASARLDPMLFEAARGLGASTRRASRTIFLPLISPALPGFFALLWALCASELATTILIYQPGGQTLPMPIFSLMHIGATQEVAALSLTLFALMLARDEFRTSAFETVFAPPRQRKIMSTPAELAYFDELWNARHEDVSRAQLEQELASQSADPLASTDVARLWRAARLQHFLAMQAQEKSDAKIALRHFSAGENAAQAAMNADLADEIGPLFWRAVCKLETARLRGKVAMLRVLAACERDLQRAEGIDSNFHFRRRAACSGTFSASETFDSRRRSRSGDGAFEKRAETFPRQFHVATLPRRSVAGRPAAQQRAPHFARDHRCAGEQRVALGTGTRPVARAFVTGGDGKSVTRFSPLISNVHETLKRHAGGKAVCLRRHEEHPSAKADSFT